MEGTNYPRNLLTDIGFESSEIEEILGNREKLATLEYLIFSLTERKEYTIHSYYRDGKTYEDISKHFNVSRERSRQWLIKARHYISNQKRKQIILHGIKSFFVESGNADLVVTMSPQQKDILSLPISVLELDLAVYNPIRYRAGFEYVWQLYLTDQHRLLHTRNLGPKKIQILCDRVKEVAGFDIMLDRENDLFEHEIFEMRFEECKTLKLFPDEIGINSFLIK